MYVHGHFLPGEEKAWGNLITISQHLQVDNKKARDSLFTRSHMEKTRAHRYKLQQEKFYVDVRNKFFTVSIHWNNLPRDVVRVLDNLILSDERLSPGDLSGPGLFHDSKYSL